MLKIMLVDDERTVLQGISHIIRQYCPNYEIAGMAQKASDALHMLEHTQADVVITDVKMPEMDGIELTGHIRTLYPHISIIILSGYAEFEYVRQAMKHGAHDYLLKPCHYQSILEVLSKIEKGLAERGQQTAEQAEQEILKAAAKGKRKAPAAWLETSGLHLVSVSCGGGGIERVEAHLRAQRKAGTMFADALGMARIDDLMAIVYASHLHAGTLKIKLAAIQQLFLQQGYVTYWAIGSAFAAESLAQAFADIVRRLDFLRFNDLPLVMTEDMYDSFMEKQRSYGAGDYFPGRAIGQAILKGDAAKLKQVVEAWIESLSRPGLQWDPKRLKSELFKQLLQLEQLLADHGVHSAPGTFGDCLDALHKLETFRDTAAWLRQFTLSLLGMGTEEPLPGYIQAAVQYMESNYMEELCLKTVSDRVHLNPWYFSSQFKKYMGVSFSEYLNQVRVRMAKQFLKHKDLKVYQVAEMVGFQDAAYFSTVFKNMEQMSPKDYQKTVS
ncbi:hypothetical protein SD70_29235 [Gordoniibacillus kamchatkensis]|uniref:DNA-binding response regulator n=1 Tax=Gordoniibacillus kamchatkensis TaxID=1590651 RepID=A0ABR5AAU6_9BACL|nr:response regulator [Paenibacillus sp. VKM B-2647]KIL38017.1 hypothetical protein SD70_29235 [Paenibacillus sp. VKM B-2647]